MTISQVIVFVAQSSDWFTSFSPLPGTTFPTEIQRIAAESVEGFLKKNKKKVLCIVTDQDSNQLRALCDQMAIPVIVPPALNAEAAKTINSILSERRTELDDETQMVAGFCEESKEMLEQIEAIILEFGEGYSEELMKNYLRILHTFKGTAACIGFKQIAEFSHKYEDFLMKIKTKEIAMSQEVVGVLLNAFDILKQLTSEVEEYLTDEGYSTIHQALKIFEIRKTISEAKESAQAETISSEGAHQDKTKESLSVSLKLLDEIMGISGELTVVRGAISKLVNSIEKKYKNDTEIENLGELLDSMNKLTGKVQNQVSEMRKIPLKNVFRPYKRLVRDLSVELGKEVQIQVHGEDLLVDTIVSKVLSQALVHMIRNSLDHGIESPEIRKHNGKSPSGKIQLSASLRGDDIIVELIDDGKGLNPDILIKKALEKKLYTPEEISLLTPQEIYGIIFLPGFSTAAQVTDISGRGVGMDMACSAVQSVGGRIDVDSKTGFETKITLIIPVPKSVMIIKSLVCKIDQRFFMFPCDDVAEVLTIPAHSNKLYELNGSLMLTHHDAIYPILTLDEKILRRESQSQKDYSLILLKTGKTTFCVAVDEIQDIEEIVIKKIDPRLNAANIFQGATLIGNGTVGMIFSTEGLAKFYHLELSALRTKAKTTKAAQQVQDVEYLLFENLEGEKLTIPLDQVYRLEQIKGDRIQRSGDHFLVKYRDRPLILLGLEDCQGAEDYSVILFTRQSKLFGVAIKEVTDIVRTHHEVETGYLSSELYLGSIFLGDMTCPVVNLDGLLRASFGGHSSKESQKTLAAA
jgi:two-component system, chemotaxis family, sensor kinase CheA